MVDLVLGSGTGRVAICWRKGSELFVVVGVAVGFWFRS